MTERGDWQFDLEVHPAGWTFPAGHSWVAGWLWSPHGRTATDVRGWINSRAFLAIHGLPKPALEAQLFGRAGPPYLGFSLLLAPQPDARIFRLEVRDESGVWHEIFRTEISAAPDATAVLTTPPSVATVIGSQIDGVLRRHVAEPAAPWETLADDGVSAALAEPLNSLPNPPFYGALEEPRGAGWVRYGRISVTGWLAHRDQRITRITAMIDPQLEVSLLHGLKRNDVGAHFANLPGRDAAAFLGLVDLPAVARPPALLKVFAELENGEKHLAFAQRFVPRVIAGREPRLPFLSRVTFARAAWALWRSARRHRLPASTVAAVREALKLAWTTYAANAPARVGARPEAAVATVEPSRSGPLRVLVVTHNLNYEGAPWFIFELARYLSSIPGATVRIVSPQEGPLRAAFAKEGLPVEIIDVRSALGAPSEEEFERQLVTATRALPWDQTDLVIGNTMVAFWAVLAAHRAGKPALLYVHESSTVRKFFAPTLPAALLSMVEKAFVQARHVVFTAAATQTAHAGVERTGRGVLLPSWIDVARVDEFVATSDSATLRRKHGLEPDAVLLVNIGSLCERKGQHVFIQAADLLKDELRVTYPGRKIRFLIVGARPGVYLEMLREEVARLGLAEQVLFEPETGEIFDFYRLADIFVCTSFEESFPRVLLESAAFRLPIVSTNVDGIAEMLGEEEAWLTPPGDRYRLAEALKAALAAHFSGDRSRPERARATVLRKYHQDASLPLHLALARSSIAAK
ncbi:MAG: hypothetical protein C0518_00415 [Opitutus sp.]|nr:hypothetical protein [Opitutus sp.]